MQRPSTFWTRASRHAKCTRHTRRIDVEGACMPGNVRGDSPAASMASLSAWPLHEASVHCQDSRVMRQTFLDCDFLDQYLRWTSESGWVEEAFVPEGLAT